jgi:hypothetical protein
MFLSNLYRIFISFDFNGLHGFLVSILVNLIIFLRFTSILKNLQQEMNIASNTKKLSENSSAFSTVMIKSINCDNKKVFSNKIIMIEYIWYTMRLCSDDQEFGRQQPNIVRSLNVN